MFKKFKDKLAEEMKQSPSRLQAGMQQLAQAVISPAASNNLIQDITTSIDDLNLDSEKADTLRNNSATSQFQSIDLSASNSTELLRRSSFSSVTSENFFPSYESPGNLYNLQSDMEQSASEFEDSSSSSQLQYKTKDELYAGYQKLRIKYTKYRAVYRELYKENMKMKSVLVETQDKALRRIANLKEQCQLEQEAKAHLEEALRNDIEEKDHLIDTLTTKIRLLQISKLSSGTLPTPESDGQNERNNIDLSTDATSKPSSVNDNLVAENSALKEKVKKFEVLLAKCNESLKKNKEKISQLTESRDILERDLNIVRNNTTERTEMLESEIYNAKREILSLNEQVDVLKKREEDSSLSLAENKLFIHRELEVKEEQNKQLQEDLSKIAEYRDILAEAVVKYDHEFKQFEIVLNDGGIEIDKKVSQLQDLLTNKSGTITLIQQDVKKKFLSIEGQTQAKHDRGIKQWKEHSTHLREAAKESIAKNEEMGRSRDELEIKNVQLLGLSTELKSCKSTINDLKEMLREVTIDWEQAKQEKECLIANMLEYKNVLGKLRQDCHAVRTEIKQNYSGQVAIIDSMNKELVTIFKCAGNDVKNETTESGHEIKKEFRDIAKDLFSSNVKVPSVEFKTIIDENNALKKKCEYLMEQNEHIMCKLSEFDKMNSRNVKLIAEIDELNFKLRDITELEETQYKLQLELERLKSKSTFSNNVADNNDHFTNQVFFLKGKLDNYDALGQDNTSLKQELVELKDKLAATLNNMESLKLEQHANLEVGLQNFSQKCIKYENMIVNLTSKYTEQTLNQKKLHEQLAKQKASFRKLNERYENKNFEYKETNDAFARQASKLQELDEKYKIQCAEIESLREKETEFLNDLVETVKVREHMITKLSELEACKNNVIDKKNNELQELKLRHERTLEQLESFLVIKNEVDFLSKAKAELTEEIERLRVENNEIGILRNNNIALQFQLDESKANNIKIIKNKKEFEEEQNDLSKLNGELKLSQTNLQQENDMLKTKLVNLRNELQHFQEQHDATSLSQRISELSEELEIARVEVQTAEDRSTELYKRLDVAQLRVSEETASKKDVETRNGILIAQVSELEANLNKFEDICRENFKLHKEINNLRPKIQELDEMKAKNIELLEVTEELNSTIETLGSCEAENRILNSKMENLRCNITELEHYKSESIALHSKLTTLNESIIQSMAELTDSRRENKHLALKIKNLQNLVDGKEAELNSLKNLNTKLAFELQVIHSNQTKALEDKSKTIAELEKTVRDFDNTIVEHRLEVDVLTITKKELQDQLAKMNADHLNALADRTGRIIELEKMVVDFDNKLMEHKQEVDALKITNKELHEKLEKIKSDHSEALEDKLLKIAEIEKRAQDFENKYMERKHEVDAEKITNKELREQLGKMNADHSTALEDKVKTIAELEKATKDFENKLIGQREEVDQLEAINKDLREQLMSIGQDRNADEPLVQNNDRLQDENEELRTRLDEAVILYDAKQSQMEILNQELKHQAQVLIDKLKTNEQEQSMRIKQLVKEFQAQIHDKDEQIQAALEKRFERQQNYESNLIQQYKEQLKDFQIELTIKSEQIENLIMDNKETILAYKAQIEELTQAIAEVKKEHSTELQNIEQNWKIVLMQRTDQLQTKHTEEMNELMKEWLNERKSAEYSDTSPRELESTSRVAMATIQSNTGSLHSLQQTLISQKRELSELRKLLRIRNESLEGSTEIEYLRNILFEYMMGRETLVLTRVISAVVKFDQEQTSKVLKKEEDKLTLFGSLGLL